MAKDTSRRFDQFMRGLIGVSKKELAAEIKKYERAKARRQKKRKK